MSTRLKNTTSGVTVEVADEKVARLGSEWQPEGFATPVEAAVEVVETPAVEPKRAPGRPKKLAVLPE